jgi:drug/metabolite transporter (DMT)-like permease
MGTAVSPERHASRNLQLKTALLLLLMVTTGPLGNVLLREGMKQVHLLAVYSPSVLLHESRSFLANMDVWLGIGSRIASALAFLCLLSWADYSFVNPASSVSYGIVVLMGWLLLGEVVPLGRWLGVVLICLGAALVGRGPARTTKAVEDGNSTPSARRPAAGA